MCLLLFLKKSREVMPVKTTADKLAGIIFVTILKYHNVVFIGKQDPGKKGFGRSLDSKIPWRGYYCCVPECKQSTARNKNRIEAGLPTISFHSFPNVTTPKDKACIQRIR